VAIFYLFERLTFLYQRHLPYFPKTTTARVWRLSKEMLTATVALLYRCIDLCPTETKALSEVRLDCAADRGSLTFLQKLIETMSSQVVKSVFSTCEKWQDSGEQFISGCAKLRRFAEKAERSFDNIAASQNFMRLSFELGEEENDKNLKEIVFHHHSKSPEHLEVATKNERKDANSNNCSLPGSDSHDDDQDDDASFGIHGCGWGKSSSD
jgi:hypothetical protein